MDVSALVAKVQAKRRAAGLVVSFDRTTPEETAAYGRATAAYASTKERDQEFDRLAWLGRSPRVEQ